MNDLTPLSPLAYLLLPVLLMMSKSSQQRESLLKRADLTMQRRENKRELKALQKHLQKEARFYLKIIQQRLAYLGFAYLPGAASVGTDGKVAKRRKVRYVPFSYVFYGPDVIQMRIEVAKLNLIGTKNALPYQVRVADIIATETIFELSMAVERDMTAEADAKGGAWLMIHRSEGTSGLPNYITFQAALLHYPDDPHRGTLLLGSGINRVIHSVDLDNYPHVLVAGTSGGGKSNMVNNLICQLTMFNTPDELRLILVDLKRVEFTFYKNLPHLLNPFDEDRPIIIDAESTVNALQYLYEELERRTDLFEGKAKKLSEWNQQYPDQRLPRLMMVIDEWSVLVLGRDEDGKRIAKAITNLTTKITSLGRAVGIHLMIATQRPDARVLDPLIRMNMSLTIAGSVPTRFQSQAITGTGDAAKLDAHPGRMLYMVGPSVTHLQTPHCTNDDVAMSVKIASGRAAGLIELARTNEGWVTQIKAGALVVYVHDRLSGDLRITYLQSELEQFGISHADVKAWHDDLLKQQSVTIDGREFAVEKVGKRLILSEVGEETEYNPRPLLTAEIVRKVEYAWVTDKPTPPPEPMEIEVEAETQPPAKPQLTIPATVPVQPRKKHPMLLNDSEVLQQFIDLHCQLGPYKTKVAEFYEAYERYCQSIEAIPKSKKELTILLKKKGIASGRGNYGVALYVGIEVNSDDNIADDDNNDNDDLPDLLSA